MNISQVKKSRHTALAAPDFQAVFDRILVTANDIYSQQAGTVPNEAAAEEAPTVIEERARCLTTSQCRSNSQLKLVPQIESELCLAKTKRSVFDGNGPPRTAQKKTRVQS